MKTAVTESSILRMVLTEMAREGYLYAPVGVSMRHVHLSRNDLQTLFGEGYELHPMRDLVQPGQFAAQEQVLLEGPKGRLEHVRIIGPVRGETQVELSLTDAMTIGLKEAPVRMSGALEDTPSIRIQGPKGAVQIPRGVIIAARHLHLSEEQARAFHVHDRQTVCVRTGGERPGILEQVICRVGTGHELEFHVDTDEANALLLKNGDMVQILTGAAGAEGNEDTFDPGRISDKAVFALTGKEPAPSDPARLFREETCTNTGEAVLDLVTEQDINLAEQHGKEYVLCTRNALVTPSAKDRAAERNIRITRADLLQGSRQGGCSRAVTGNVPAGTDLLELVTASELNAAFRDDKKELYCTKDVIITPAAMERIAETGIRIVRV